MIGADFRGAACRLTEHESPHFHADYEMLYISRGWMEMQVSERNYRCAAPCVAFFGNLETHRIVAASDDYERYVLTISPKRLRETPPMLLSLFRSRPAGFSHMLSLEGCEAPVQPLFDALTAECARGDEHSQLCAESLVQLLLANLHRFAPAAFPAGLQEYPEGIVLAQRFLDEHFCEPVSIDEIARRFYMSPSYFRHLFQELIGLSPKQYVVLNRLARARELLAASRLSVAEIAERCGFSDVSNFIRRFKAHYGVTPHHMRKMNRF